MTKLVVAILVAALVMAAYQGWVLAQGEPGDRAVAIGFFASGCLTLLALRFRNRLVTAMNGMKPGKRFVIIGGIGAALVETFFWAGERATGAVGVAASPDLAIDLLITMPWYLLMMALLWKVVTRYRYTLGHLLLLGGIYDVGADGIVGGILGGNLPPALLILLPLFLPLLIVVYSAIIVPAFLALRQELDGWPRTDEGSGWRKALYALLPLLGLTPYLVLVLWL